MCVFLFKCIYKVTVNRKIDVLCLCIIFFLCVCVYVCTQKATDGMYCNQYTGQVCVDGTLSCVITPIMHFDKEFKMLGNGFTLDYAPGCDDIYCNNMDGFEQAMDVAFQADKIILIMGNQNGYNGFVFCFFCFFV